MSFKEGVMNECYALTSVYVCGIQKYVVIL